MSNTALISNSLDTRRAPPERAEATSLDDARRCPACQTPIADDEAEVRAELNLILEATELATREVDHGA